MVLEESSDETLDHKEDEQVGPGANEARNITGGSMTTPKLSYSGHVTRRQDPLEKTRMPEKNRQPEKRKTNKEMD